MTDYGCYITTTMSVPIIFEALYPDVEPPKRSTAWAAGLDVKAHLLDRRVITLEKDGGTSVYEGGELWLGAGARVLIPLGFKATLPEGWEMQVRSRSGLALRHGISVLNAPGTIDADYIGEWAVLLMNHGAESVRIAHGDRVAQLVPALVVSCQWTPGLVIKRTDRLGGFGSTGR